jgi:hypothetical protein
MAAQGLFWNSSSIHSISSLAIEEPRILSGEESTLRNRLLTTSR